MHKRNVIRLATLTLTAVVFAAQSAVAQLGPNLIVNGSFETPTVPGQMGQVIYLTFWSNQSFPGWTVTQGSVDIHRGNGYDGVQHLDLNGSPGTGGVAQTFTVPAPGIYRLSFAMSAHMGDFQANVAPNEVRRMRVELKYGATSIYDNIFSWDPAQHPVQGGTFSPGGIQFDWHTVDIPLLSAGDYTLRFTSLYTSPGINHYGPLVDDVRFQLVPEPASVIALGAGLAGLLKLRRWKV